mgnify:CR=1 FL=1
MHHSPPSAITYPSSPQPYYPPPCPTTYPCPTPPSPTTSTRPTPPSSTTDLTAPRHTSQPHTYTCPTHSPTTYPCPPPSPTTHLTALLPAHDLLLYSAIYPTSAYPTYVHTTAYPLLRSHLLHILSRTPHTRTTLPTALPISPTDVPCPPMSYRLYLTALPRTPLSSI